MNTKRYLVAKKKKTKTQATGSNLKATMSFRKFINAKDSGFIGKNADNFIDTLNPILQVEIKQSEKKLIPNYINETAQADYEWPISSLVMNDGHALASLAETFQFSKNSNEQSKVNSVNAEQIDPEQTPKTPPHTPAIQPNESVNISLTASSTILPREPLDAGNASPVIEYPSVTRIITRSAKRSDFYLQPRSEATSDKPKLTINTAQTTQTANSSRESANAGSGSPIDEQRIDSNKFNAALPANYQLNENKSDGKIVYPPVTDTINNSELIIHAVTQPSYKPTSTTKFIAVGVALITTPIICASFIFGLAATIYYAVKQDTMLAKAAALTIGIMSYNCISTAILVYEGVTALLRKTAQQNHRFFKPAPAVENSVMLGIDNHDKLMAPTSS